MRSAFFNRTFVLLMLLAAGAAARGQVNPHTQIRWPASCASPSMVYSFQSNTCIALAGITWRGTWSGATTYALNDAVSYLGGSYISTANGNTSTPPSATWNVLSQPGSTGPPGPTFNGGTITNPLIGTDGTFAGNVAGGKVLSGGQPMIDVRNPSFAGGIVCNDSTDGLAAFNAGLAVLPKKGGQIEIVGGWDTGLSCRIENPNNIVWPILTGPINLSIQGRLFVGTTLDLNKLRTFDGTPVNLYGLGGGSTDQFMGNGTTANIELKPSSGTCKGTLGTAVSTTVGTPVTVTFTPSTPPSSNPCIQSGSWATVAGTATCNITTISRTNNVVTATLDASCPIKTGTPVGTVAGVADSTFNTDPAVAGQHWVQTDTNHWLVSFSDQCGDPSHACTLMWNQAAADATSSGGTFTAFSPQNLEQIHLKNCTSTTCDAVFFRSHATTDQFGIDAVVFGDDGSGTTADLATAEGTVVKDIVFTNTYGTGLFLATMYLGSFERIGVLSVQPFNTVGNFASWPMIIGDSSYITIRHSTITGAAPWTLQMTRRWFDTAGGSGPVYIENSFVGSGIYMDHGASGLYLKNVTLEHMAGAFVSFDPTVFWSTVGEKFVLDNVQSQDSYGLKPCALSYDQPAYTASTAGVAQITGAVITGCLMNSYFKGNVINNLGGGNKYNNVSEPRGIWKVFNDGNNIDASIRGGNADFSPAVLPHASVAVLAPASWTNNPGGTCTKTTGQVGPDGTATATAITSSSGACSVRAFISGSFTPAVGDMFIFGGWEYTPTLDAKVNGGGDTFSLDNNGGGTHWSFGDSSGTQAHCSLYDSIMLNDWWHPVVCYAKVVAADGTSGQHWTLNLYTTANQSNLYWQPFAMFIPASEGFSQVEVLRWRQQLFHGYVPSGAAAGKLYAHLPVSLPGAPVDPNDAAPKSYVDSHVGGITGPGSSTVGHSAVWADTAGLVLADGGAVPAVIPLLFNTPALVERAFPTLANPGVSAPLAGCTGQTVAAGSVPSAIIPFMNQMASGASSGNCVAVFWGTANSPAAAYWQARSPVVKWGFGFSATSDFTANSRIWIGLFDNTCTLANVTGNDAVPASCHYGAIRWSTSASDSTWQCVSDNGSGTPQVTAIGSTSPIAAYQLATVAITPSSVTCTIGATSVTNSTKFPGVKPLYDIISNTTLTNAATHLRLGAVEGYSLTGTF